MRLTTGTLAQMLEGQVEGDPNRIITGVCTLEEGNDQSLAFLYNSKYMASVSRSNAGAVVVGPDYSNGVIVNPTLIRVARPYVAFLKVLTLLHQQQTELVRSLDEKPAFVSPEANIASDVYLGAGVVVCRGANIESGVKVYPNTYVGSYVHIGANSVIYPNVTILHNCVIGKDCIIHAGTVIGSDGFGYYQDEQHRHIKIPQVGNVVIGDNVEIGSNVSIDRATIGSTRIEHGVKIDNLVHIAHNVTIGAHSALTAQVGIAGSTKIGKHCGFGGQSGIAGHLTIADGTRLGAQAGVSKSITTPFTELRGSPAQPLRKQLQTEAFTRRIPELLEKIKVLEAQLQAITNQVNGASV